MFTNKWSRTGLNSWLSLINAEKWLLWYFNVSSWLLFTWVWRFIAYFYHYILPDKRAFATEMDAIILSLFLSSFLIEENCKGSKRFGRPFYARKKKPLFFFYSTTARTRVSAPWLHLSVVIFHKARLWIIDVDETVKPRLKQHPTCWKWAVLVPRAL